MQFTGITTSAAKTARPRFRSGETGERFQRLIRETEDGSEKSEYNPGIYRVTDPALNIRTGPGVEYPVVGVIKDQGSYTITEIRNKSWGRLLSGAGWINCHKAYCFYGGRV